ncbi:quinol-cytochrome oxidoreductase complex cytochrome b subunit [Micromonospora sp. A200]|uniref:hypothetical protein n=1 Tax=Micromonospora sp. A200 TaxID=2940568 RepID=UPI0024748EE7|nr:hypothetical protein [Micromonospora sp. A200]MDH6465644.1 quinol-cytochrome oxidoreductase complex cytochrome b subunit [Micromonospora sp. A200]
MPATVSVSPQPTPRTRRLGLGLVWLATALAGTTVVVTGVLLARMDEIFASAVSQGRALPFTGEASEQSMLPFVLGCALTALFLTTAALGYLLRGWAYHSEHIGLALPAAALIIVIVLCTPLVAPIELAREQYTHDLYGWWYFPFLIATVTCHLGCLLAAAVVLSRTRST